jgi:HlyD family secretion protein
MSEGLFRKASIDKVSSPEQLDLLMRVTSPVGWVALVAVAVMLIAVGVWSVLGSIPDLVDARGTLFRGERIYDIKATLSGNIVTLDVRPGSLVVAGQTIAKLKSEQPSPEQISAVEQQVAEILSNDRSANDAAREKVSANGVTIAKNRAEADGLNEQLGKMQAQYRTVKQLVDQGIKAPKDLFALERDMEGVKSRRESLLAEVHQLEANSAAARSSVRSSEGRIAALRASLRATSEVKSGESGRVVEVIKSAGDKVAAGESLIRIERNYVKTTDQFCGGDVHALVYVPASGAGKVKKGQFVRVSPSDVKKEEYGYILGTVEWVSSYTASTADMTEKLKNDQLVKQFMGAGPVVEARICLNKNPENKVNSFRWSSSQGPPTATDAGTTCSVSMVVDEKKPYTYVIPAVRRAVGI